jgi:hypothetical protein
MPLINQPRKLSLAHVNPSPVRLATRAELRVASAEERCPVQRRGFQWPTYPNPITMRTMRRWREFSQLA